MSRIQFVTMAVLVLCAAAPVRAQESLSVTLLTNAVSFSLSSGQASNPGSLPLTVTTAWTLLSLSRTQVVLNAYFASAPAALLHTAATNTINIPSSRVEANVNGGANAAFTQTLTFGAAGAGRQLFAQSLTALTRTFTRIDVVGLNINLNGYVLPADTYTGTLRLRAQATP